MGVVLRQYQLDCIQQLRQAYACGRRAPLLVLATGGGKTICFAYVTSNAAAKGKRVLIVAHRRELIRQASRKLSEVGVTHGIIAPGFTATRDPVQIASIQTLSARLNKIGSFDLIVIDEGHHAPAGTYVKLIASQPDAKLLLVTATPERLDGRGLGLNAGGCCDDIVIGPSSGELIKNGYLTPVKVFAPATGPDLSGVRIRMGDYEKAGLSRAMGSPTLVGDAVEHYARHSPGQPAVAFCVSVEHAKNVAETFRSAGWKAIAAHGKMSTPERDAALGGLVTGSVQVLCVCDIVSEGLDIPGISVVIILRATKSLVNYLQWIGRGLRPVYASGFDLDTQEGRIGAIASSDKPHCLILDHAGSTLQHGMPDDDRDWSLDGRPKKAKPLGVTQCPECFAIYKPAPCCPECGHSRSAPEREVKKLEIADGQLEEINQRRRERIRYLKETPLAVLMQRAHTREQIAEIAHARGYKPGWIFKVMQERTRARSVAA